MIDSTSRKTPIPKTDHQPARTSVLDEIHELGSGAVVRLEAAPHRRGNHRRALLLDPSHHHAEVTSLNHHGNSMWIENLFNCVGNLIGQALLNLKAATKDIDDPGDLAQADDLLVRKVCHVSTSKEREHVVLTQRVELDILDDHHLVGVGLKDGIVHRIVQRRRIPARQEVHRLGDPQRGTGQTLAVRILAQGTSDA